MPFDPAAGQQSESLVVASNGDTYVSWSFRGQIVRIANGSVTPEAFASVPLGEGDFGILGLAIDADGDLLAAVNSATSGGVWRFDRANGNATFQDGSDVIAFPNDLTTDPDGNIYVTSSTEGTDDDGQHVGAIWRVAASGEVTRWLSTTDLGGTAEFGFPVPVGANGIRFDDGSLLVANSEKGQLWRVAINDDGSAGSTTRVAEGPELAGIDGIAIDGAGNVFAAIIAQSSIIRIDTSGTVTQIAGDADGLDFPSAVAIGAGDQHGSLLAVNFAIAELLGGTTDEGPALLAVRPAT